MILHRTYSFDADKFHRDLEHRIVSHSKINFDSLYQIATQIAEHPSEIIRQVFEDIRYDDDWLHGELKEPNRWYMISLASVLEPSPPLAIMSRNVLSRILPLVGWKQSSITLLLLGKNLNTLPGTDLNSLFGQQFTGLTQYGSWLSRQDLENLYANLYQIQEVSALASKELADAIQDYVQWKNYEAATLLMESYNDALIMLRTPLEKGHALFISSD